MQIEFGGGEHPRKPNYKQVDIRKLPKIDFVCNAWEIDTLVPKNSVSDVYSRHFFEHLTFHQGSLTLKSWFKILKTGGRVEMILPNMMFHIKQWLDKSNQEHANAGFWGWQRDNSDWVWDIHKSGYDKDTLKTCVEKHNFKNYKSLDTDSSKHLHVEFFKS